MYFNLLITYAHEFALCSKCAEFMEFAFWYRINLFFHPVNINFCLLLNGFNLSRCCICWYCYRGFWWATKSCFVLPLIYFLWSSKAISAAMLGFFHFVGGVFAVLSLTSWRRFRCFVFDFVEAFYRLLYDRINQPLNVETCLIVFENCLISPLNPAFVSSKFLEVPVFKKDVLVRQTWWSFASRL